MATSEYLQETARKNIEGEISMEEVRQLLDSYYEERPKHGDDSRTEEADKVSVRIAELPAEREFSFTPNQYMAIHRRLFQGIYSHAGRIREYNIKKRNGFLMARL